MRTHFHIYENGRDGLPGRKIGRIVKRKGCWRILVEGGGLSHLYFPTQVQAKDLVIKEARDAGIRITVR